MSKGVEFDMDGARKIGVDQRAHILGGAHDLAGR